jgi:hypothetical protein
MFVLEFLDLEILFLTLIVLVNLSNVHINSRQSKDFEFETHDLLYTILKGKETSTN